MGYSRGELIGGNSGGGGDMYKRRVEPMLVSLSDSYSNDDNILVYDSRPSSSPAYTITDYLVYWLLP